MKKFKYRKKYFLGSFIFLKTLIYIKEFKKLIVFMIYMELNKISKIKSIKISKNLIDITENKPKVKKTNLKSYILKPKNKDNQTLVIIETGSFIIQL